MIHFASIHRISHPIYHYKCAGFIFRYFPEWFVMDDFGNAVVSLLEYDESLSDGEAH